jgi:N-succinyldiaminopimelate aminotransferase
LPAGSIDPERQVLPVHGTREALFAIAQAVVDASRAPLVLLPNPFYQIYEGAALLAGAECVYLPTTEASGYQPDYAAVAPSTWERCQLLYVCSPGNPTGAILEEKTLTELIERAERYDFVIAADECYSEIYRDEQNPPAGLLQAALRSGRSDFRRCLVFNSLSKRSNLPGLRSGFVAGDAALIERFLLYRTYHGCAMPLPVQAVSTRAWQDEAHVQTNRTVYREKFDTVSAVLGGVLELGHPPGGFFLWPRTPYDELRFTRELYARYNVTVLPGRFLSRLSAGLDPGVQRVRIALVAPLAECVEAAQRIREFVESQPSAEGMAI